ncbi:metallophosphoesterase [Candidatus Koribacter versatilis Ellin345]|uniref:Metallophosphoesterase n=1 Tax=Koribacter versatilis (strain Ellin345) TaxID=204669 RepID=Q1IPC0_KORVE|nr:carboxypeptidase regulatory-like domain-containing protein [Candidatus Koribacter versatilis]ABF41280.1 metallophosphoesterase [Candidatus Koribacter versatilis Ellin345]
MRYIVALRLFLFVGIFTCFSHAQAGDDFTIAALPDTQFYSKSYPQIFAAETEWILNNSVPQNIKFVVGLGDIVDGGGEVSQWQNADSAYNILDRKIPFLPTIGNHDYDRNNPAGRTGSTVNYNNFFGPARFSDRAWYKGSYPAGSNENFYAAFTIGSHNYLVVVLEVFPRDSSLQWAASIIQSHPTYDVIVVTHAYTFYNNTRMDHCDENSAGTFGVSQDNDGEQIWEKLVSKYSNIVMVLSGHVVEGDGTGRRSDFGVNGNLVNQILADYQSYPNGGNGYIRLITVSPSKNTVSVKTYSPYLNRYMTDDHNQFTVAYKNNGSLRGGNGAISGVVKNVADCSRVSNAAIVSTAGNATTDSSGSFSIDTTGPKTYQLGENLTGYGMAYGGTGATVVPGQPSPIKVFVSTEGMLRGQVTLNGAPVANATVFISGGSLRTWTTVTTAGDGSYNAGWLPFGSYTITATTPSGMQLHSSATVQVGISNTSNIGN